MPHLWQKTLGLLSLPMLIRFTGMISASGRSFHRKLFHTRYIWDICGENINCRLCRGLSSLYGNHTIDNAAVSLPETHSIDNAAVSLPETHSIDNVAVSLPETHSIDNAAVSLRETHCRL